MQKGMLIVLSAPSGTGKGTVINELRRILPSLKLSVSATTREPRNGERHGIDYFFLKKQEFQNMIDKDEFLEYAQYCQNFYGTPKSNVFNILDKGDDVILEIEVAGGAQIKKKCPDSVSIFVVPPSISALRSRLIGRGTDDLDVIENRLNQAARELKCAEDYDYIVVNDSVDQCVQNVLNIINAERMRVSRSKYIIDEVLKNE